MSFPVTYSTLSIHSLVRDVLPDYSLDEISACRFYSTGFNDSPDWGCGWLDEQYFNKHLQYLRDLETDALIPGGF